LPELLRATRLATSALKAVSFNLRMSIEGNAAARFASEDEDLSESAFKALVRQAVALTVLASRNFEESEV